MAVGTRLLELRATTSSSPLGPGCPPSGTWNMVGRKGLPGGRPHVLAGGARGPALLCPTRFFVNFAVGQSPGSDIAFHFNPRFDGLDKVVFNSQQGGHWGKEERKREMPFRKGCPFELVFMILPEHYKVGASPPCSPLLPSSLVPSLPSSLPSFSQPLLSPLPSYLIFVFSYPSFLPLTKLPHLFFSFPFPPPRRTLSHVDLPSPRSSVLSECVFLLFLVENSELTQREHRDGDPISWAGSNSCPLESLCFHLYLTPPLP